MREYATYLDESYRRDPETGAFIVDIDLGRYADVFNDWDRGPMRRRDIDPDLLFFLRTCSSDIPLDRPIRFSFSLSSHLRDTKKEEWITAGLRNYFAFSARQAHDDLRKNRADTLRYVVIAFVLISLAYLFQPYWPQHLLSQVATEGLIIGGWVFLWEAISAFVFKNREVRRRLKEEQRFLDAPLSFEYHKSSAEAGKEGPPLGGGCVEVR